MATFPSLHFVIFFTTLFLLINSSSSADQLLSVNYYNATCPSVLSIVKTVVQASIIKELRMGASLLRLHFHDCFVNGCDASVLLDVPNGEKEAVPNKNSARGFEVIDQIKTEVEKSCPGIVSCADLLAIAARDSVVILGGPHWEVKMGRRDSLSASKDAAERNLPSPFQNLDELVLNFQNLGLSERDLVVLSGSHTIGQASCVTFRSRIYNETNIDRTFATRRQGTCPRLPGLGDHNTAPLDLESATHFDNQYFKNLMNNRGLIHSDQELFKGGSTDHMIRRYSTNLDAFFVDYAAAMTRLGGIGPSPRSEGEVRRNCRRAN